MEHKEKNQVENIKANRSKGKSCFLRSGLTKEASHLHSTPDAGVQVIHPAAKTGSTLVAA